MKAWKKLLNIIEINFLYFFTEKATYFEGEISYDTFHFS